ncbi:MAG TPA: helix-turn-helix domain-containing protein [Pseudonocardia sp.]|uniref:PucR family transcriptional regulator n=1 Tax=Pseudonocardia sp. TaxID=60912 RepID=UPI002CCD088E|nr:helix-turn-helix domain-containing protein [Pseudonocardia sp.]HTF49652.1 helix-turn-helix domain-containing protein [Pseudonocardia sp.]
MAGAGSPIRSAAATQFPGQPDGTIPAAREETARLRKLVALCSHLSALAGQDADLAAVARVLSNGIGAAVAILDRELQPLASAGIAEPGGVIGQLREHAGGAAVDRVLLAVTHHRRALTVPGLRGSERSLAVAPVSVGQEIAGYLVTRSSRDAELSEDLRLLGTEHAAMVCGMLLARGLVIAAAGGRARQELVDGLLLAGGREDGEVDRWAQHLGLDTARAHYVFSVSLARARGGGLDAAESLLARLAPDAVVTSRADEVVAILPAAEMPAAHPEQARALARAFAAAVTEHHLGIAAIGIGGPSPAAAGISRAYTEARRALTVSERMGEFGGVTAFADLGIHRLLVRIPDIAELRAFASEVLGELLEQDNPTNAEYLATLSYYFAENNSPRRTAQRLHVHPNTVSYRIRRIEEITGLSFTVHRDRLMAEVAVEILAGLRSER